MLLEKVGLSKKTLYTLDFDNEALDTAQFRKEWEQKSDEYAAKYYLIKERTGYRMSKTKPKHRPMARRGWW